MSVQQKSREWTVKELGENEHNFHFDLAIQRKKVWKEEQKSLLIHSLIMGYPVPPVFCWDKGDDQLWFLDGKQRLTTVLSFIDGQFKITTNTPEVVLTNDGQDTTYQIAGKFLSEFDEELKKRLDNSTIYIVQMSGLTEMTRDLIFHRLNNGSSLRPIELTRVLVGSKVMGVVKSISEKPFFTNSIPLTMAGRNRFTDEEIVMQIWSLVEVNLDVSVEDEKRDTTNMQATELGGSAIRKFTSAKRQSGIDDSVRDILVNVTDYLGNAFPVEEDFLKKVHIPMIFMMAWKYALSHEVDPIKFGGWVQDFFKRQERNGRYRSAANSGSAKKENVKKRLDAMSADYRRHIETAPDYVIPTPKVASTRGRRKNIEKAVQESDRASKEIAATREQAIAEKQASPMWTDDVGSTPLQVEVKDVEPANQEVPERQNSTEDDKSQEQNVNEQVSMLDTVVSAVASFDQVSNVSDTVSSDKKPHSHKRHK